MAKHVIILGAGASADAGAPMMANFLDEAQTIYSNGLIDTSLRESFSRVFQAISRLQGVHSKSEFDLINIESIFTAFEMAKTLQRFPGTTDISEIEQLITDLKWVIVETISQKIKFPVINGSLLPTLSYSNLVKAIKRARTQGDQNNEVAIITFNYDIALDLAIHLSDLPIDYGFAKETHKNNHLPLLKLHGSLNWASEQGTGRSSIVPWYLRDYLSRVRYDTTPPLHTKILVGRQLSRIRDEGHESISEVPVIVPPSWNKAGAYEQLSAVWAAAAEYLSEADSLYIVGYSLPTTDTFFRQLYALGTVGPTLLRRFWLFNPDESRHSVFEAMLGPGARERFLSFTNTFDEAIEILSEALKT